MRAPTVHVLVLLTEGVTDPEAYAQDHSLSQSLVRLSASARRTDL